MNHAEFIAAKMHKSRGFVIWEGSDVVAIATMKSKNTKTGNMVQVHILHRHVSPLDAIASGADSVICGDCKHRGNKASGIKRSCYVRVGKSTSSVWRAYKRGSYYRLPLAWFAEVFRGRAIRLGAYGDPAMLPEHVIAALTASNEHTGYSHQWRRPELAWLAKYCMASVDNAAERIAATQLGWRTFEVTPKGSAAIPGQIFCPATSEGGSKSHCIDCLLCSGTKTSAKNIAVWVHGAGAKNFVAIESIR